MVPGCVISEKTRCLFFFIFARMWSITTLEYALRKPVKTRHACGGKPSGRVFSRTYNPLFVTVTSTGAACSMGLALRFLQEKVLEIGSKIDDARV